MLPTYSYLLRPSSKAKPSRLFCNHCDETYGLPQNGNIKLHQELKCPLDDFEVVWFI